MDWSRERICQEIIYRSDEDFHPDYAERAWYHFQSAIYSLLSNPESNVDESDFQALVVAERLILGRNCNYPNLSSSAGNYFRILGGYHYNRRLLNLEKIMLSKSVLFVPDVTSFNYLINNPITKYGDTMYVHLNGQRLVVFPHFTNCFIKYIRNYTDSDIENASDTFSSRFLWACIEMSVVSFKREVTEQETQ